MVDETGDRKGRATPSRKQAEAARKQQMKVPASRKEQAQRQRAKREAQRAKQREALRTGEEKYLPARDQGPARRFARDYVDRRWNVGEFVIVFLLAVLVLGLIASLTGQSWAAYGTTLIYPLIIIGVLVDEFRMVRGLKRELRARFDPSETGGVVTYAVFRTMQLRRTRLPKTQLKHGEPLRDRY